MANQRDVPSDQEFSRVICTVSAAVDLAQAKAAAARALSNHTEADEFEAAAREAAERLEVLGRLWTTWQRL